MDKLQRLLIAAEASLAALKQEALRLQDELDTMTLENEQLREERMELRSMKAR